MDNKTKTTTLMWGTILMLGSNIIVKGLGFFYRVVLVRLLGTEVVGLLEMATPLFSFLLVLAGCGIQTALSQLIASRKNISSKTAFNTALILQLIGSLTITVFACIASPWLIENFAPDQRIAMCFKTMLPAIIIISAASAFRGLLQGEKYISTLGMSQNAEQVTRVIIGIWLASKMAQAGLAPELQVTAASIATVCGELLGFIYLLISCRHHCPEIFRCGQGKKFSGKTAGQLLSMGLPLTGSRLVLSGIMMLQAFMIPLCLKVAGWDIRAATEIYGRFAGVAMALFHLPGVFTSALTVSVLPAVAESMARGENGRRLLADRVNISLQAASSFTMLGMILLFVFAQPLCALIFDDALAAPLLRILAAGGIFFYLQNTLASILQGLGDTRSLLLNNIAAGIVLIAGIYMLTSLPQLGINGAAIAVVISWLCGFALNLFSFFRKSRVSLDWRNIIVKPLLATGICLLLYSGAALLLPKLCENTGYADLLGQAVALSGVYMLILWRSGGMVKVRRR